MGRMTKTETVPQESLPALWNAAYERDRSGETFYADPAPERRAAKMLAAFILAGLCFLALPGTLLGVWNLLSIAEHHSSNAASVSWIQAHGQAQLFGWVGTFILGISMYVLPKFQSRPLKNFGKAWVVWGLWTVGVAGRWWVGVSPRGWRVPLVFSGLLELAAFVLAMRVVVLGTTAGAKGQRARKKPQDLGSWLGIFGFGGLGLALIMSLLIAVPLALRAPLPVYPPAADRAFLLIALWAFAVPAAWGYSTKFVTIFLGLEQPIHRMAAWLCAGIAATVVCALARQFLWADLLALLLTVAAVWALKVFRPSRRPPKLVGVYRHYPAFVRAAYGWLVVGAILGLMADAIPAATGLGGASRHAVTVGFLATLIFAIGPRVLPAFLNGRELYNSRLMAASLWILNLGCLLRVSSEAVAYSMGGAAWGILPISALLELTAVMIFVVNMGMTLKQPMPAWFGTEGVNAKLALYWYVTSFPKTRPLLIRMGLRTLSQVKSLPRSLTLADAVNADGANVEEVLAELRTFFSQIQPRRVGREQNLEPIGT